MPFNDVGRVLRAAKGRMNTQTGGIDKTFAYAEDGSPSFPCPVGTRNWLRAAGFLTVEPDDGSFNEVAGDLSEPSYRLYEPTPRWGKRGALIRVPRCAVVILRNSFNTSSALFCAAVRDAISAEAGRLTAAGISLFVGLPACAHAYIDPFTGPLIVPGGTFESQAATSFTPGYSGYHVQNDIASAIGGDLYWAWAGGIHRADHGSYETAGEATVFYPATDPGAAPPYFVPSGFLINGIGGSTVEPGDGLIYKTSAANGVWKSKVQEDAGKLAALTARLRSFRFAFVMNGWGGDGLGGADAVANADPYMVGTLAAGFDCQTFVSGGGDDHEANGSGVGQQILNDMGNFFGL